MSSSPIAQALIDHYVQQIKAEQAARERRSASVKKKPAKAAEVKGWSKSVAFGRPLSAEELRRAEEAKNSREAKRVVEQERAELVARALRNSRKALDEARRARDAAQAAERRRYQGRKSRLSAQRDAEAKSGDPQKAASLPKLDKSPVAPNPPAAPVLSFDGD